ncbi:MAG TPA: MarR family transcriptional regulator [Micromonosporaceae bacterium]|jgi:DNA-binding MarR family transcriptional regulator
MQRSANLAASIEAAAESLGSVLEAARGEHLLRVSPTQLRVLTWLKSYGPTNVNGLAESLGVGPSSASRLCDRLEALGLLRRSADPRDRREVQVLVTPDAERLLDEMSRRRRQALDEVLALMPEAARLELARSLTAFSVAADALGNSSVAAGDERRQRSA